VLEGCNHCADPITVVLREKAIQRLTDKIAVFRCPECGCLILDDMLGFKGSGTTFRATAEMIDAYVQESGKRDCGYQYSKPKDHQ
jgi:hypothetical protein